MPNKITSYLHIILVVFHYYIFFVTYRFVSFIHYLHLSPAKLYNRLCMFCLCAASLICCLRFRGCTNVIFCIFVCVRGSLGFGISRESVRLFCGCVFGEFVSICLSVGLWCLAAWWFRASSAFNRIILSCPFEKDDLKQQQNGATMPTINYTCWCTRWKTTENRY